MDETEESRSDTSSSSDNERDENQNVKATDPIFIAKNAGACLSESQSTLISHKKKIHTNQGKNKRRGASIASKGSAFDRQRECPSEHFAVVSGMLRCNACSVTLSLKKRSLEKHIKLKKHSKGISRIMKDKKENLSIIQCLNEMERRDHLDTIANCF